MPTVSFALFPPVGRFRSEALVFFGPEVGREGRFVNNAHEHSAGRISRVLMLSRMVKRPEIL